MTAKSDAKEQDAPRDPVRRWTLIVLGLIVILFLYSLIADRLTPYTSQATVQAFVVRMAPEVAGRVIEVNVIDNQKVKAGDVLFRIDPQPFEIARQQADARLAGVGQSIGASTAAVSSAQERLVTAQAKRDNTREQVARIFQLVEKGVYAKAREDQATAQIQSAEAAVREAEAELERAKQELGPQGPIIRSSAKRSPRSRRPSSISSTPPSQPYRWGGHQSAVDPRSVRRCRPGGAYLHRRARRLDQRQFP